MEATPPAKRTSPTSVQIKTRPPVKASVEESGGGTLLSLVITYPDKELRDQILDTGMTDGMEMGYTRLEEQVLTTT